MKIHILYTLPLAASLMVPAMAQQTSAGDNQQPAATSSSSQSAQQGSSSNAPTTSSSSSDQDMSARQPLEPDYRQGFWGKINPFARKKYVQRQLSPVRNRVNELDDLTAANSKQINDVDARAQQGIQQASAKASDADQHAVDAGNRAQQANQAALQASNRLNTVENVVGNIDQYQPTSQTEIRFRPGQTKLSTKAQAALDDMAANLKSQKGYVIEVQGFSPTRGQAGISTSQAMADSVVRYLVEKHDVPVYRIFVMGMGNAQLASAQESSSNGDGTSAKPYHGNRVEISLLKNNVDQLASSGSPQSQQ
jgi:outer membrane protein OmpA-like peptidoglycan-associated protein